MVYDIFISHSSKDEDEVKSLCEYLENKSLKCFVSYRDISAGESYPGAITRALRESEMLLLILSSDSNESTQVDRELTLANDQKKKLSCFRLEDVSYSDDKAYLMSGVNWLDAFPSSKEHYFELLQDICRQLGREVPKEEETEEKRIERYKNILGDMLYHANDGNAEAQFALGRAYDQGRYGLNVDIEEAVRWMHKAAQKGHLRAENSMGFYCSEGIGVEKDMKEAFRWYRLAALNGNEVAQSNLGLMYYRGEIIEKDITQAIKWWKLAADQGFDSAMVRLGDCYYYGEGVEQEYTQAVAYYSRAARLDNDDAQVRLASCYRDGKGTEKDIDKCVEILTSAAEKGSSEAMVRLAQLYDEGKHIEPNYTLAFNYLKSAADKGNNVALYNLARFYYKGLGCEQDEKMWFEYLEKAAMAGNALAQDLLGDVYSSGNSAIGIARNPQKAAHWYNEAIKQDNTDAMVDLGLCYSNGGCLPLNDVEAAKLFKQASEQGDARGQFFLSDEYQNGDGVEQSDIEAFNWCVKSAEQGYVPAMVRLGEYFFYGIGTEQNFSHAVEWLTRAADEYDTDALYLLGVCYEFGYGVEKDFTEAVDKYYAALNQNQKSDEAMDRLVEKAKKTKDKENPEMLYVLGIHYSRLGGEDDRKNGIEYFEKAIEHGCHKVAMAYKYIGICYRELGDSNKALENAQKALELNLQEHGEQHIEVAYCHNSIALAYRLMKKYDDALEHFNAAFEIRKAILLPGHNDINKSEQYIQETLKMKEGDTGA